MRIAHFAPRIGAAGGISTYIRRLGEAQINHGLDVRYYCFERPASGSFPSERLAVVNDDHGLFAHAREAGVKVLHLHRAVDHLPEDRVPTVRTMHGHQGGCPSGSRYLARTGSPCHRDYTVGGCLWGHIVDRCGSVRPTQLMGNFLRIRHEVRQSSVVPTYTVSNFLKDKMVRAGCSPENLQTIHSPAPEVAAAFQPVSRTRPPRLLYLGRLVPQKGLDWVLRALAEVDEPVMLDVAGEGPMLDELKTLAASLRIAPRVRFHGWVTPDRVASLMREARGVVFPSVWHEPAGLVTLEAAAHGRALLGSRVGGIPEYAHPSFARLVNPRDIPGLANAIAEVIGNPDLADRLGQQGYTYARTTRTMQTFVESVDAWYARALAMHTPVNKRDVI